MSSASPKPTTRPACPQFSSGPCAKRPGWNSSVLTDALVGRSHRSTEGVARLKDVIETTRRLLNIPADYLIGIVPASDTGAVEMALWNLLGSRPVDVMAFEVFSQIWADDITGQLKLPGVRVLTADYGQLPDLNQVNPDHDVVFCWNGTTSGVCVPNGDWIREDRQGLTICDATSAVFALPMPWEKLDAVTFSWQKALGGEAGHGMIILSPRAVERIESYTPPWPLPKVLRLTRADGKIMGGVFAGKTINTPSMLCVEDVLDALRWVDSIGGQAAMQKRAADSLAVIDRWVVDTPWAEFLATRPETRSPTSVCIKLTTPDTDHTALVKSMADLLAKEGVAYDIKGHRDAPPHIRLWTGGTVETADVEALLPWLVWAYGECVG